MKCIQCGQEITDGAAFCPICGGKQTIQAQAAQPVQQTAQPVQPNFYQQAAMQQNVAYQQPRPSSGLGNDFSTLFGGLFSDPVKTLKGLTQKASWIMAVIFIAVQSLFSGLVFLGVNRGFGLGMFSSGSNGKAFGMGLLVAIGINGFFALFIWVFMGIVAKKQVSFLQALTAVGFKSLGNAPFLLLGFLLGLANLGIGLTIDFAGMVLGYLYMLSAVEDKKDESTGYVYKRFAAIACTVVASAIWFWLMGKIF